MSTLPISRLTNLPWFMDLTFHVLIHYCSLQHQTLLPSPVTPPAEYCFHFGSILSFFLELFLHSSPIAYWKPADLRSSCFSAISFCLFIPFMRFSRQEYLNGLPFLFPVDHILSELSTMTRPPWEALTAWLIVSLSHGYLLRLWDVYNQGTCLCISKLKATVLSGTNIITLRNIYFPYWTYSLVYCNGLYLSGLLHSV